MKKTKAGSDGCPSAAPVVTAAAMRQSVTILLLLLALGGCEVQPQPSPGTEVPRPEPAAPAAQARAPAGLGLDRSHAGSPAPGESFEDPDGAPATLADLRGRPVLLNLWATWCAPCVKELPTLDALAAREGDRLQVVTLSQDMEGRSAVESFLAPRGFRGVEAWLDQDMKMMSALGVSTLPTTILFDAEGREVWRMTGDEDWAGPDAAALISEAYR